MDIWNQSALSAWEAVLEGVNRLRNEGRTLDQIAKLLGIKNRALISEWISGNREAINAPFPNMLRYLDALGYNIVDFLPYNKPSRHKQYSPTPYEVAFSKLMMDMLAVHNLTLEKISRNLWPEQPNMVLTLRRMLHAEETFTIEIFMYLCQLMDEEPNKIMRLAQERVEENSMDLPLRKTA